MQRGFWEKLEWPIVGLSPMDGVTDAAFRYMVCKYSLPAVVITEFTNVEGLARGAAKMLRAFKFDRIERPVVAQVYGVEVDSYYKVALMLCALGFDGIDINMGCPANKVAKRGSGAGLIRTPELAKEIVISVKRACKDWAEGVDLKKAGVDAGIAAEIEAMNRENGVVPERVELPVSVKTRIGFDEIVVEEWVNHLLEVEPANISMHGRTLKQMYLGRADWDAIARGAEVVKQSGLATTYLGNGDIESMEDAHAKIKEYGVDGVLIGRAAMGDPWLFGGSEPSVEDRLEAAVEHAELFAKVFPDVPFVAIRKHLAWYCKGFDGAKDLRIQFMKVDTVEEVKEIAENFDLRKVNE